MIHLFAGDTAKWPWPDLPRALAFRIWGAYSALSLAWGAVCTALGLLPSN